MSSLSDERVIEVITRHFVPAWLSRDRYQMEKIDREEQLLVGRIDKSRRDQKFEGGSVCVYIADASGKVYGTLIVHKAWKPELLVAFLKKIIAEQKVKPRDKGEEIKPAAAVVKREPKSADGKLFAVRTRFDGRENRGTSRDVVELTKVEWSAFVAPAEVKAGQSWKVDAKAAEKLLRLAYPPLPHWNEKLAKLEKCELTAKVSEVKDGEVTVRLEGKLDLIYPHHGKKNDGRVTAKVFGVARCEGAKLTRLELTSDEAVYTLYWQDKLQPLKPMSFAVELMP